MLTVACGGFRQFVVIFLPLETTPKGGALTLRYLGKASNHPERVSPSAASWASRKNGAWDDGTGDRLIYGDTNQLPVHHSQPGRPLEDATPELAGMRPQGAGEGGPVEGTSLSTTWRWTS